MDGSLCKLFYLTYFNHQKWERLGRRRLFYFTFTINMYILFNLPSFFYDIIDKSYSLALFCWSFPFNFIIILAYTINTFMIKHNLMNWNLILSSTVHSQWVYDADNTGTHIMCVLNMYISMASFHSTLHA